MLRHIALIFESGIFENWLAMRAKIDRSVKSRHFCEKTDTEFSPA